MNHGLLLSNDKSCLNSVKKISQSTYFYDNIQIHIRHLSLKKELLRFVSKNPFLCDVIIIDFGGMSDTEISVSLKLAKEIVCIHPLVQYIFISDKEKPDWRLYEVSHVCYLVKPIKFFLLKRAVLLAIQNINSQPPQFISFIPIVINRRHIYENIYNIMYIKTSKRNISIFTSDGNSYEVRKSISEIQDKINDPHFLRCHKSFFINSYYIEKFGKNFAVMCNGAEIPISRGFRNAFEELVLNLCL